jgi:hypothetical protein
MGASKAVMAYSKVLYQHFTQREWEKPQETSDMLASLHNNPEVQDSWSKSDNLYTAMLACHFNRSIILVSFLNTPHHLYGLFLWLILVADTYKIKTWWFSSSLLCKFKQKKKILHIILVD